MKDRFSYFVSPVSSQPLVADALAGFMFYSHAVVFAKQMSKKTKDTGFLETVIFKAYEVSPERVRIVIEGYYKLGKEVLLVGDQEMDLRAMMEKSLAGAEKWHADFSAQYAALKKEA